MNQKLEESLKNVEMVYKNLVEIANDWLKSLFDPINEIIQEIEKRSSTLSIDSIREYILTLQLKAFSLSEIKDKSNMKSFISQSLYKEAFAISFNSKEGAIGTKEKLATIDTSGELTSTTLFNLVSDLIKTKLDQLHRLVDCLKSILMSKMQEYKYINNGEDNKIPLTTGVKYENEIKENINK